MLHHFETWELKEAFSTFCFGYAWCRRACRKQNADTRKAIWNFIICVPLHIYFTLKHILISLCPPVVVAALIIRSVTSQPNYVSNILIKDKVVLYPRHIRDFVKKKTFRFVLELKSCHIIVTL